MRRVLFALAWAAAVPACTAETAGLGGDLDFGDATIDSVAMADDTQPLFGDDGGGDVTSDDVSVVPDDTGVDTAGDTAGDTASDTASDTEGDAIEDTELDTGGGDAITDTPEDGDGAVTDAISDASDVGGDTGGSGLVSAPGKVSCSKDGAAKQCSTSDVCRGCVGWDLKWHWDCGGLCVGRDFSCDEKADCDGGKLCCAKNPWLGPDIEGSECRSSCGDDAQLCATNAECAGGKTCVAQTVPDAPHTIGVCK